MPTADPSDSRLEHLDAGYTPILTFDQWGSEASERISLVAEVVAEFEEAKAGLPPALVEEALSDSLNAAALETGAIEGLYPARTGITLSVIEGVVSYHVALSEMDDGDDHALINGQRLAFDLALDTMTSEQPLSEAMIREIHRSTCAGQDTYRVLTPVGWQERDLGKGTYKENPNHVVLADGSTHSYAPVGAVSDEMHRLIEQTRTESFRAASGVMQSAYLHHSLTHIHPFADGNGRTARVVASIPLLEKWSVPLVVLVDRDAEYRSAQADADRGATHAFVAFVEAALLDLLGLLAQRLRRSASQFDGDELKQRIERLRSDPGGYGSAAARLEELAQAEVRKKVGALAMDEHLQPSAQLTSGGARKQGWTNLDALLLVQLTADVPGHPTAVNQIRIAFTQDDSVDRPLAVFQMKGPDLLVRVDEVAPRPKQAFRSRLEAWVESSVAALQAELVGLLGGP